MTAATFTVAQRDPQATDDGPGTPEQPWKTLGNAAGRVRAGDIVLIRDGVYREKVSVKTSGTPDAPILFEAAPGAHVVLTGTDRLSSWHKVTGNHKGGVPGVILGVQP